MLLNFTRKELECGCGCGGVIEDEVFLNNLQRLRGIYGRPMILTSAYRCPEYNATVSSTGLNGPHTQAAVDVKVFGEEAYRFLWMAISQGFHGIGVQQKGRWSSRFIHIDMLRAENRPRVWSYP